MPFREFWRVMHVLSSKFLHFPLAGLWPLDLGFLCKLLWRDSYRLCACDVALLLWGILLLQGLLRRLVFALVLWC